MSLAHIPTLHTLHLYLSYNLIHSPGATHLTKIMQSPSITTLALDLHGCYLDDGVVPSLENLLQSDLRSLYLHLGRNDISSEGLQSLASVCDGGGRGQEGGGD